MVRRSAKSTTRLFRLDGEVAGVLTVLVIEVIEDWIREAERLAM
jgi:hypothetical protein